MRNFLIFLLLQFASLAYAQDSTLKYQASILAAGVTSGSTPFWEYANQNGTIPLNGNFVSGQWNLYKTYNKNNPRNFQWSGGIELITNYEKSSKIFLTDIYIAGKIGPIELMAGQKKMVTGLMDTTLTSGSLSVSGNSRPFPRVQLSIPQYLPLAFTGYWAAIKFSYSDGLLNSSNVNYGSTNYVPKTYFHQKTFYLKLGKPENNFHLHAGINHQVIWGGEKQLYPSSQQTLAKAYWLSVTGKSSEYKKTGDHFGTVDFGLEWKGRKWSYYAYRQNIYETGSILKFNHLKDGLGGIRIKRNKNIDTNKKQFVINSVLFEFISTKDQTNNSPLFGLAVYEKGNYFNSLVYSNGWAYRGRGIGTPLIPGKDLTNDNLPEASVQFTNNNRISAYHTGFDATFLNTYLIFKCTYSQNLGTYLRPFDTNKNQLSFGLKAEKNVIKRYNVSIIAGIATDIGKLYPNSNSILFGIRTNGYFNNFTM